MSTYRLKTHIKGDEKEEMKISREILWTWREVLLLLGYAGGAGRAMRGERSGI
jgi:hypothetical protein